MRIHNYDLKRYNFPVMVAQLLQARTDELSVLHFLARDNTGVFGVGPDQKTVWHDRFYGMDDGGRFMKSYREFVQEVIQPIFAEPLVYQKKPTFRVQYTGNVGVGEFHKDKDYHHNRAEVNIWLPVTEAYGNNTIWVESKEDAGDYHPIRVSPGQFLQFNGCHLKHGNKINDTGKTRVSFDFRVIPQSQYKENPDAGVSVVRGIKFVLGGYYELAQ